MAIEVKREANLMDGRDHFSIAVDWLGHDYRAIDVIIHEIARGIAERYIADHYQEIVAQMDQKAMATLAVAEGAAAVRKTLEEKIPDKVLEVTRTEHEVYQRGFFGGMTRIR